MGDGVCDSSSSNAPVLAACYASAVAGTSLASYLPNAIGGTGTLFTVFVCCLGCVPVCLNVSRKDEFSIKNEEFVSKPRNCVSKTRNFVVK